MNETILDFLYENPHLNNEVRRDGKMSEHAAAAYAEFLVRFGKMSRFKAAEEKRRRSIRE